jgi:hypothetical protein
MANGDQNNQNGERAELRDFTEQLSQVSPRFEPVALSQRALDNVSVHDFAFYEYLFPTEQGYRRGGLSDHGLKFIQNWEQQNLLPPQVTAWLAEMLAQVENTTRSAIYTYSSPDWDPDTIFTLVCDAFYADVAAPDIEVMLAAYSWASVNGLFFHFVEFLDNLLLSYVRWGLPRAFPSFLGFWQQWGNFFRHIYPSWVRYVQFDPGEAVPNPPPGTATMDLTSVLQQAQGIQLQQASYDFEVFPHRSVNVGLRLVYRQEWKPLGIQKGEIVRTVPLGPGQRQRVSTKIVRRRKTTSSMESVTARETTTETTDSAKDSSDIVAEAAESFNWKVDAELHGGVPFLGGSVSTSFSGSEDSKSKQTASRLSEAMRKSASKVRSETKVTVSVETEETFESEFASEIQNPNNEMAISYEFHTVQQQYQVFTSLAEVQSVIFVGEYLPGPTEITEAWIRRHDWIIAKYLKDESYRTTLNELIQDEAEVDPRDGLVGEDPFERMASKASEKFATFSSLGSGGTGPGLSIPDIYAEPQRIYQQELRERAERTRANKLRATQRSRLLDHIRQNILYYCRAIWMQEDPDQRILRYKKEGRRVPVEWTTSDKPRLVLQVGGQNHLVDELRPTGRTAPLWEVIDPTGPIAYIANYAVFGVRPLPEEFPDQQAPYYLQFPGVLRPRQKRTILDLNAMLATLRAPYERGGVLHDPALTFFEQEAKRMSDEERHTVDDLVVLDFVSYLPELEAKLVEYQGNPPRPRVLRGEKGLNYQITEDEWAQYLYRKNGTRRFLVDSNNLYLSLRTGEGAALEPFKRAHRYIDVLKASEELTAMGLKNVRRRQHMGDAQVYDPDVEKVVVVGDSAAVAPYAATLAAASHDARRPGMAGEYDREGGTATGPDGDAGALD